jgi:hypothetical protein
MEQKKTNPLSPYGVTDKEFDYFETFYRIERMSYWKGVLVGSVVTTALIILITIIAG